MALVHNRLCLVESSCRLLFGMHILVSNPCVHSIYLIAFKLRVFKREQFNICDRSYHAFNRFPSVFHSGRELFCLIALFIRVHF